MDDVDCDVDPAMPMPPSLARSAARAWRRLGPPGRLVTSATRTRSQTETRTRPRSTLLVLAAVIALAGCRADRGPVLPPSETDRLVEEIRSVVPSRDRARDLVAIVVRVETLQSRQIDVEAEHSRRWLALNADYEATAADFEALRDARTTQRKAYLDTLTTLRIEIAALLTTEEWRRLESARGRVRDSLLGS